MQGKDGVFHAKAAQEMAGLRRLQSELEAETGNACFLGLSAAGTVQQCLRLGNARAALRVKNDFRLPERHFAVLKVRASALEPTFTAAFCTERLSSKCCQSLLRSAGICPPHGCSFLQAQRPAAANLLVAALIPLVRCRRGRGQP